MIGPWHTTSAPAHAFATLVVRQRPGMPDEDTVDSKASSTGSRSRASRTTSPAETATARGAKTVEYAGYQKNWFEENPATTVAACALGLTIVLFGLLAVYCYFKYRTLQAKLALENAEVETGRVALEEKQRALSAESGNGTYPHFGASKVPLKQSSTLDDQSACYQSDEDLSGSFSLDDVPQRLGIEEGHKKQQDPMGIYAINEDEEEDLRSSQMHGRPTSSQQAYSEGSDENLSNEPSDDGQSGIRPVPHPSPASAISNLATAQSNDDPRLMRPELKTLHKGHKVPDAPDLDARDSVYSIQDQTKYA